MYRVLIALAFALFMVEMGIGQEVTDPGLVESRRMPQGRQSRGELRNTTTEPETIPDAAEVTPVFAGKGLLPENTPFPPRGFARGTVAVIGDDSGPMGTYRLAFRYEASGQMFPFIECKMFEAFENHLDEHGPKGRRGEVVVEVKGYVTQYRGTNFLFLHDYRMPPGKLPGGGKPAASGSATTKPN